MGDEANEFITELIRTFLPNAVKLIEELKTSLVKNDIKSFYRAAHTLKSSSASLGAMLLSDYAKVLENESKELIPSGSQAQIEKMETELDKVTREFEQFLAGEHPSIKV